MCVDASCSSSCSSVVRVFFCGVTFDVHEGRRAEAVQEEWWAEKTDCEEEGLLLRRRLAGGDSQPEQLRPMVSALVFTWGRARPQRFDVGEAAWLQIYGKECLNLSWLLRFGAFENSWANRGGGRSTSRINTITSGAFTEEDWTWTVAVAFCCHARKNLETSVS